MAIKNYIWDFDGMLFDTYPHTLACFIETYRRHGIEIDPDEAYRLFKITMWDAFDFYHTDEAMKKEFYALENDISFPPPGTPYELIPETLEYITTHGGQNFLYTHRDMVAKEYLDKYDLTRLFTGLVTSEMNFPLKPSPDAIEYIVKEYSLDKNECMMLGDRAIDVGSGLNAGIVGGLFDEDKKLAGTKCTIYTNTIDEIFSFVRTQL
jgi:phosphoglycolate phosphatase-like HAD superfamily hydrolase